MQLAIRRGCLRETIATINLMVSHNSIRTHNSTFLKKKYRLKLEMQDSLSLILSLSLSLSHIRSLTLLLTMIKMI